MKFISYFLIFMDLSDLSEYGEYGEMKNMMPYQSRIGFYYIFAFSFLIRCLINFIFIKIDENENLKLIKKWNENWEKILNFQIYTSFSVVWEFVLTISTLSSSV